MTQSPSVPAFLATSPHAKRRGALALGFGRSAALWQNAHSHIRYDAPRGHTLSFYIKGGDGTWRVDGNHGHGWPGALCIMPEGVSSEWEITEGFEFLHLYLPDDELRRAYAETFDRDARLMDLADVTYGEAGALSAPFAALARATEAGAVMAGEEAMTELVAALFGEGRFGERRRALSGGLAPHRRRRVLDFVEAHLDAPLRLDDLAAVAGLSPFHFQRAFRESLGVSPHVWLAHRRIERAKALIEQGETLAQVAAATGFSSQSHLTRAFRAATGATPAAWRAGRAARAAY